MSKLLKNTVIILFIGILFSCSKDDDNPNVGNEENIIGTWKLISETEDGVDITESCDNFLVFTSNQVTFKYFDDDQCTQQLSVSVPYVYNGNEITTTENTETYTVEVLELSATTLKIKQVDSGIYITTYTKQ